MKEITITKRNGKHVNYNADKIRIAVTNANRDVLAQDKISNKEIDSVIVEIEKHIGYKITVEEIQDLVEEELLLAGKLKLAKEYIKYRYSRELIRKSNSTDTLILDLIRNSDRDLAEENSNKNTALASTQRDYVAGIVSRDISNRILLPKEISKAHESGILHFHDEDYFLHPIFNCCLVNMKDMLDNGTVMNGKMIDSPKTFRVACTVMTQIIASVASNQYGGQSVNIKHLGKYLSRSVERYKRQLIEKGINCEDEVGKQLIEIYKNEELSAGVQTIQYQINTLMTTNGQAPFVTLFLELDSGDSYLKETAEIIEEILQQRIVGVKNKEGIYITPAFPKLVYVLDNCNCLNGGVYDYLTKIAAKCSAKRMYPDYISAKIMRQNYEGNVFSPMGCRSFLSPWKDENNNYKFEGRFNQGIVSLNLPRIALDVSNNENEFWILLEERLNLCYQALVYRHRSLEKITSDISPIHWQYGAIARLKAGESIKPLLHGGYSTISLGYIGLYETSVLITGGSHTTEKGKAFALKLMGQLRKTTDSWKKETGIGFALYGTPAESLCYRFALLDKKIYGEIKNVTDKGYYTNSYHVDVSEDIDAISKFEFEAPFQTLSSGGAISYIEVPNMQNNMEALEELISFIYDNILYAEFNTRLDDCHICRFNGEILINNKLEWVCPHCGNKELVKMNVTRRTCGYLGENFWNVGKTKEISKRVLHL